MIALLLQVPSLDLTPMPSGLFKRIGGYMPFGAKLSDTRPVAVRRVPEEGLRFGAVTGAGVSFTIALGKDRLYADTNGDGDLTDDPATTWTLNPDGRTRSGSFTLDLPIGGKTVACTYGVYETGEKDGLGYYADYALAGKATFGTKRYDAIYNDPYGMFDGTKGVLMVDKDGDGKFHPGYEFYSVGKPFNIDGTTYEVRSAGGQATVVKSDKTVPEVTKATFAPEDPNLKNGLVAGRPAIPFQASAMGGQPVAFPGDYRGKVVLLDFWATWCGPCMREVPNVVKAYRAYHARGFEVLGVSLDKEKAEAQIKAVTAKQGMAWNQVYDGRFFDAAIAKRYGIVAIPATYLVDGDTGRILAAGDGARGAKLGPAIERALLAKRRSQPSAIL